MAKKQSVTFREGKMLRVEYSTIGKSFEVDVSKYSPEIRALAMAHGFKQKFGDAASGGTPAEKFEEVQAIHASLLAGEWERTATVDLTPLICQAVSRIKKVTLARVEAAAKKAGPDKVKEWGTDLNVKAEIAKIRAEKAAQAAEDAEEIDIEV